MKKKYAKAIDTIDDMKKCFKYKIRKGKKGEIKTIDEAEIAIYQLSLNILLLKDFLTAHAIDHKRQSFDCLAKELIALYASIANYRCECFSYDNPLTMGVLDEYQ